MVLDTNVLISAFLTPKGTCGLILNWLLLANWHILTCDEQIRELVDVLSRDYLRSRSEIEKASFINGFQEIAIHCQTKRLEIDIADAKDAFLFQIATEGTYIISGDRHVCDMDDSRVLTPKEFAAKHL